MRSRQWLLILLTPLLVGVIAYSQLGVLYGLAAIAAIYLLACIYLISRWSEAKNTGTAYKRYLDQLLFGLESSPQSILFTTAEGNIAYANGNFCELIGLGGNDLTGKNLRDYRDIGVPDTLFDDVGETIAKGEEWHGELFFEKAPPSGKHTLTTCRPIFNEDNEFVFVLTLIDDISDEKVFTQRLYMNAHYDAVTGLPNRSHSIEKLEQATLAAKSRESFFSLVYINLDRFKLLNDSLGHNEGDQVLNQIAGRLRNTVHSNDLVSNLGGDKFMVLLQNQRDEDAVRSVVAIRKAIAEPVDVSGQELSLSASIGLTTFPDDAKNAPDLLRNAESAMYHAREQGGDGFYRYRHEVDNRAASRLAMESHLRYAIDRDELHLAYQPVISLEQNELVGAEALLRWRNRELDNPTPDMFIPIAEETGLILPIGDWVLEQACLQAVEWRRLNPNFVMAVNICAKQFEKGHILNAVEHALSVSGLPPHCLELEVTERLLMGNDSLTKNLLYRLKDMNVRLALDDFGTGYASLSYLKQYPFDLLKIDRSFIADCQESEQSRQLVLAIVSMAHSLGMKVIGEGVERLEQRRLLKDVECDMAQGYLFTPAITADRFTSWADQYQQLQIN